MPAKTIESNLKAIAQHGDAARKGAYMILAAPLALGAEYLKMERANPPKRGRRKKIPTELEINSETLEAPLRERVAKASGFSEEWCRRCKLAAERVIHRLKESSDQTDRNAAKILESPPEKWGEDDYKGLGEKMDAYFDADTFNALLLELNVMRDRAAELRNAKANAITPAPSKKVSKKFEAYQYVFNFYSSLRCETHKDSKFPQRLKHIKSHSDDPDEITLAHIEDELKATLRQVEAEKKRRGES